MVWRTSDTPTEDERTLFFHDGLGQQITVETDETGDRQTRYLLDSSGSPLGQEQTQGATLRRSYFVTDPRGNLTQLLSQAETVRSVFAYDPFGKPKGDLTEVTANWDSRLRFQMAPKDAATGNYNLGARLMNPDINRFIGADNYVGAAANVALQVDPLTGNRYMYAGANPAGMIDDGHGYCPFGHVGNHESRCVTWAEAVGKSKKELKALPATVKEGSAQLSSEIGGGARDFASDPGVRKVSRNTWAVGRAAKNAPITGAALVVAKASGADCGMAEGIMAICGEASAWAFEGGGTTYGNVFVTDMTVAAVRAQPRLLAHETKHADQWAIIGSRFGPMYLGAFAIQGECNVFEAWAGYEDGGYGDICP